MDRRKILTWMAITLSCIRQFVSSTLGMAAQPQAANNNGEMVLKKITFQKFPGFRLGITTQNFIECLPVTLANAKSLVEYSAQHGFSFIELRDPNASLSRDECTQIASLAKSRGITVAYANQRGLLDSDFWEVFNRGIELVSIFDGTSTYRVLSANELYTNDPNKKILTKSEFDRLVANANRASEVAKSKGLRLVLENSAEPLQGDGQSSWGLAEFYQAVSPDVGWQCDTANFFSVCRTPVSPDEALKFLEKHASRMRYIHLKSAQNGQAQQTLMANPLPFETVFGILSKYNVPNIAIELFAVNDLDKTKSNIETSIKYLQDSSFISRS